MERKMKTVLELCRQAREVSFMLPQCAAQQRTQALLALADMLIEGSDAVMRENKIDIQEACKQKVSKASLERLVLSRERIEEMAEGVRSVAGLPDPLEQIFDERDLPNGLHIHKQRVPLGVLAVIYESRPNVTIDVAALTIKSGNAVILRGGREVLRTNAALVDCIHQALKKSVIAETSVQFLDDPERRLVDELLTMHAYVDMLIPRGGADLHTYCRENSHIPVITGGIGICHLFVDESADLQKAIEVIVNAKVQRPTVCNALDTLLIHEKIAPVFLPVLVERMQVEGVVLHLPAELIERYAFTQNDLLVPTKEGDYDREWLSLHMNIDVVPDIGSAISFIHQHSTAHSDGILTEDQGNAALFLSKVDSAVVYVNASTRFTDGAQLGLGAEVAISTQRLHARGPMGLQELMTYKWVVQGDYHVRDK
jgi:glutamate-5-semialdehyde dehydrogenase